MVEMNRRIAGLAGFITLLILVARFGLDRIARWGNGSDFPAWAPTFGTFGETVVLYNLATEIVEPLVLLVLALSLGYQACRRLDVTREYRRFVESVIAGSTLVVAGWTVLTWYVGASISDGFDVFLALASFANTFVSTTLFITVSALAGAALTHFRKKTPPPTQPTTTNHEQNTSGGHDLR